MLLVFLTACSRETPDAVGNVRLGMAPRDVRERFGSGEGSWQTALGVGDDTVLEWVARDPKAPYPHARFEFHLGMLVAIRAQTSAPGKDDVAVTTKTVSQRKGPNVVVLARDCPTHKDEAEAIARFRQ